MSGREKYYLVDEDQSAVIAGPYGSLAELRKENPGRPNEVGMMVATGAVLEMIELSSGTSLDWQTEKTEDVNHV